METSVFAVTGLVLDPLSGSKTFEPVADFISLPGGH
ncbi:hypothetical protein M2116_001129 [Aurantimicrobium minutum]|nr:hypothetical protein [Aurantimicrobium minutum]